MAALLVQSFCHLLKPSIFKKYSVRTQNVFWQWSSLGIFGCNIILAESASSNVESATQQLLSAKVTKFPLSAEGTPTRSTPSKVLVRSKTEKLWHIFTALDFIN